MGQDNLVCLQHVTKAYRRLGMKPCLAVDDVTLALKAGVITGLVGESGSGKTTVGKLLYRDLAPDSGSILFEGTDVSKIRGRRLKDYRRQVKMVNQRPAEAFDKRYTMGHNAREHLRNAGMDAEDAMRVARDFFEMCGVSEEEMTKFASEVSAGTAQRAALAMAMETRPRLLICDEVMSGLDTSQQARVMEILKVYEKEVKGAVLYISHNIDLVSRLCGEIIVMQEGRVIEAGPTEEVMKNPQADFTKRLIRDSRPEALVMRRRGRRMSDLFKVDTTQ